MILRSLDASAVLGVWLKTLRFAVNIKQVGDDARKGRPDLAADLDSPLIAARDVVDVGAAARSARGRPVELIPRPPPLHVKPVPHDGVFGATFACRRPATIAFTTAGWVDKPSVLTLIPTRSPGLNRCRHASRHRSGRWPSHWRDGMAIDGAKRYCRGFLRGEVVPRESETVCEGNEEPVSLGLQGTAIEVAADDPAA